MSHDLDVLSARMHRLEWQLRVLKIAAVVLAVLAVAMALAPQPAAQQATDVLRVKQTDFTQTPALIRRYGLAGEEVVRPTP